MEDSRYYVFNPDCGWPKVFHSNIITAETEAKRLAILYPGTEVFVVRATKSYTYKPDPIVIRNFKK